MNIVKHSEVHNNSQQDRQHGDRPQRATQDHGQGGQWTHRTYHSLKKQPEDCSSGELGFHVPLPTQSECTKNAQELF